MKKKVAIITVLTMLLSTVLLGCGGSSDSGESAEANGEYPKMELTCAALDSDDTAKAHDLRLFMDLVTEKSGGSITFQEYWDASLG